MFTFWLKQLLAFTSVHLFKSKLKLHCFYLGFFVFVLFFCRSLLREGEVFWGCISMHSVYVKGRRDPHSLFKLYERGGALSRPQAARRQSISSHAKQQRTRLHRGRCLWSRRTWCSTRLDCNWRCRLSSWWVSSVAGWGNASWST